MAEWRQRAADFGFDLGDLTRVVGVHRHDREPVVDRRRSPPTHPRTAPTDTEPSVAAIWWLRWLRPRWAVPRLGHVESAAVQLIEACGTPSRVEAGKAGDDRWAAEPHWDPRHVARAMTGISTSDLVTGPVTEPSRTKARTLTPTGRGGDQLGCGPSPSRVRRPVRRFPFSRY